MRRFLAVLAGVVTAVVVIMIVEGINGVIYPLPPGMDPMNPEHVAILVAKMPMGALVIIAIGHFAGTLFGGLVALKIVQGQRSVGYIFGAIMVALTVANFLIMPHKIGFNLADIAGVLIAILIYMKLIKPATALI